MAEHSMCQPGRPGPQGLGQEGSPGLAPFHRAKSAARVLPLGRVAPFALHRLDRAVAQLAVVGVLAHVEVHVAVRLVGEALARPASAVKSMISSMLSVQRGKWSIVSTPMASMFRM